MGEIIVEDTFLKNIHLFLFLAVLGLHCCTGFSLVAENRVSSPVTVHGHLIAVSSLVLEQGLQ